MSASFARSYQPQAQSLRAARKDVAQFSAHCGFAPREVDDIVLAVGEALSNVVERADSSAFFLVRCAFDGKKLAVRVEDHGRGFNPPRIPVDEPAVGSRGFGLYLMNRLMDRVDLQTKPGVGAVLELEKRTTGLDHLT